MVGFAFFLAALLLFGGLFSLLIPKSASEISHKDIATTKAKSFNYVAIGDSLTQGVGDSTNQGGFVPLLSQDLTDKYHYDVHYSNYGVSGNTSNQILKRMQEQQTFKKLLPKPI